MDDPARARVGAPPGGTVDWQSIDWEPAEKAVDQLQVRIAKAVRDSKTNNRVEPHSAFEMLERSAMKDRTLRSERGRGPATAPRLLDY